VALKAFVAERVYDACSLRLLALRGGGDPDLARTDGIIVPSAASFASSHLRGE